jgi:hypothetical protein
MHTNTQSTMRVFLAIPRRTLVLIYCHLPFSLRLCVREGLEANYAHQQQKPMVPLMMEKGFSPNGWLGLLLSTAMWYGFYDLENADDATFEGKVDAVAAEIGDRGRLHEDEPDDADDADGTTSPSASEGVPPAPRASNPAVAHAPAPVPAPAAVSAAAPVHQMPPSTPQQLSTTSRSETTAAATARFSPSVRALQDTVPPGVAVSESVSGGMGVSFEAMTAFVETQQDRMQQQHADAQAQMAAHYETMQQQHEKTQTQLEQQLQAAMATQRTMQQQIDALREEARRAAEKGPLTGVVTEEQLTALQTRLTSLHEASQLTDEELFVVEDILADCVEVMASGSFVGDAAVVGEVAKIVALNERIVGDLSFARQLRRKCR